MDLSHPTINAIGPVPKVLYLLGRYTGPSFEEFPKRFMNDIVKSSEDFEVNYSQPFSWTWEQLGFAQTWLYFGLLIEVLNEALGSARHGHTPLTIQNFLYVDDSQEFVTSHLISYLPLWKQRAGELENGDRPEFERNKNKILQMIDQSWIFSSRYLTCELMSVIDNSSISAVQTSIIVLGSLLDSFASDLYRRNPHDWPMTLLALGRFSKMCPNNLLRLKAIFTQDVIYYISSLEWPRDLSNHESCREEECVAHQIVEDSSPIKHVESCKGCPLVGPDAKQAEYMADILRKDDIPLIQGVIYSDGNCDPQLDIGKAQGKRYIAISHVWSDGLGNPSDNKIPCCQAIRLGQLVAQLSGVHDQVPFWIDTICVPLRKSLRKLAIRKMKSTYEKAILVLVLDSQLQKTSVGALQSFSDIAFCKDTATRILNSGWMRRLWTLQEGRLAKNLNYQFADQAVPHMNIVLPLTFSRMFTNDYDPVAVQMAYHMLSITQATSAVSYLPEFREFSEVIGWDDVNLRHALNAVAWRSTTKPEDEAICLASILNIKPGQFLDIDLEERIPQLLLQIRKVPTSLLFTPGEKHQVPGFSWCPRSFLNSHRHYSASERLEMAECTKSGLRIMLPGWGFRPSTLRPSEHCGAFSWRIQDRHRPTSPIYFISHTFFLIEEQRNSQLAILISPKEKLVGNRPTVGVCVMLLDSKDGVVYAKVVGHIAISKDSLDRAPSDGIPLFFVDTIAETQQWCFV
jgi:hypothetical protein